MLERLPTKQRPRRCENGCGGRATHRWWMLTHATYLCKRCARSTPRIYYDALTNWADEETRVAA